MKKTKSTAKFARCAEMRHKTGMTIEELMVKVGDFPKRSSYERLESGKAIRASNAFKIANAINAELKRLDLVQFDVEKEVVYP